MRVLGIDPGSRFLGFGVVEERQGRLEVLGQGVVRCDPQAALEQRLVQIFSALERTVELFAPQAVAVEGVFTCRNARSALILGHARGVALVVAARRGLPVHEYAPARIKKSIGAGGNDGKSAVARMVRLFLRFDEAERHDATDALAVALCHLNQVGRGAAPSRPPDKRRTVLGTFRDRLSPNVYRAQ